MCVQVTPIPIEGTVNAINYWGGDVHDHDPICGLNHTKNIVYVVQDDATTISSEL